VLQATSYRKLSVDGSLLLIHGKTITSLANRDTKRPQRGSFKEKLSQNGNRLDRVRFYGSMANVSCSPATTLLPRLMDIIYLFVAGAGKSVFWYVIIFDIS
jgi:hypothetical protein